MRIEYTDGSIWFDGENVNPTSGPKSARVYAFSSYVAVFPDPLVYYDFKQAGTWPATPIAPGYRGDNVADILQYRKEMSPFKLVTKRQILQANNVINIGAPLSTYYYAIATTHEPLSVDPQYDIQNAFWVVPEDEVSPWMAFTDTRGSYVRFTYGPSYNAETSLPVSDEVAITEFRDGLTCRKINDNALQAWISSARHAGTIWTGYVLKRLEWTGERWDYEVGRYQGELFYGSAQDRQTAWEWTHATPSTFSYRFFE